MLTTNGYPKKTAMVLRSASTDDELLRVISQARNGELNVDAIASLASELAASGETLPASSENTADVASTGGPTSLSTLLCPLYLRSLGWLVPKLGVSGRPAGGLDVLAQIPGYRVELSAHEVTQVLAECGYAHFAAGSQIAPLDARLFRLRQDNDAQAVPSLVVASLLSKKLAVGVKNVGLDVRVAAYGNFGTNFVAARANARLFCNVAKKVGINARCVLTDASIPYQPYIGRGEALLALYRLFCGDADPRLRWHADQCAWMAASAVGASAGPGNRLKSYDSFAANISAQGGNLDAFHAIARNVSDRHRHEILANGSGFLRVELERIRDLIVARQRIAAGKYPDPAGVILVADFERPVADGDVIMTARTENDIEGFLSELRTCVTISDAPPGTFGEVVDG